MVAHIFDVYLWAQVGKISLYITYAAVFVVAEKLIRSILYIASFFIPMAVIDWFRARVTSVPRLLRGFKDEEENPPKELNFDTPELITSRGFLFEEHYAETADGFRLAMHRIPPRVLRKDESGAVIPAPIVYVMHGFLQSSECFVANERGLGFELANAGFDVWLGNCRGNKYSCKHARHSPHSAAYWDFCMDDVAKHDVPTCLQYILALTDAANAALVAAGTAIARPNRNTTAESDSKLELSNPADGVTGAALSTNTTATGAAASAPQSKLTYIGFSQGTAVAFACFSQNVALANRVNLFVALAPATLAVGFSNKLLDSLAKISPDVVYLMFGRTALLSTTLFWQNLLSTKLFCTAIDRSCEFLFGWDMANIAKEDKPLLYSHIYSYSSVKSVVHWFQLMRSKRFQVYDDTKWKGPQTSYAYQGRRVPGYPINQIPCPIAIFYGGRDFLVDTPSLLRDLPKSTILHDEASYEHMDFLYARNAKQRVYDRIIALVYGAQSKNGANGGRVTPITVTSTASAAAVATPLSPLSETNLTGPAPLPSPPTGTRTAQAAAPATAAAAVTDVSSPVPGSTPAGELIAGSFGADVSVQPRSSSAAGSASVSTSNTPTTPQQQQQRVYVKPKARRPGQRGGANSDSKF